MNLITRQGSSTSIVESVTSVTPFGGYCQLLSPFCFADALVAMEKAMKRDKIEVNDRQVCFKTAILFQFDANLR